MLARQRKERKTFSGTGHQHIQTSTTLDTLDRSGAVSPGPLLVSPITISVSPYPPSYSQCQHIVPQGLAAATIHMKIIL